MGTPTERVTPTPRVTPLARTVDVAGLPAADDATAATHLHPLYAQALARFPRGPLVSRGLPFEPPDDPSGRRWILVDGPIHLDLSGIEATHVVLLAFCDAWRDADGNRPAGTPVGWVLPVGEPLADARIRRADGSTVATTLRRRFEVNEGIIGWGSMAFLAVPHLAEEPIDWRGPHERLGPGRMAPPGHAGPLTVLPGAWGGAQTGVTDNVPSGTDDLMLWLHAIDVRGADGRASPSGRPRARAARRRRGGPPGRPRGRDGVPGHGIATALAPSPAVPASRIGRPSCDRRYGRRRAPDAPARGLSRRDRSAAGGP